MRASQIPLQSPIKRPWHKGFEGAIFPLDTSVKYSLGHRKLGCYQWDELGHVKIALKMEKNW